MSFKKFLIITASTVAILLAAKAASAAPVIKVVVIDTGYTESTDKVTLCPNGLIDFTALGDPSDIQESIHGSNIIGLIARQTKLTNYCIISLKVFRYESGRVIFDVNAYVAALQYVLRTKPPILNLSQGGFDRAFYNEEQVLRQILDAGTTIVSAAGNNRLNLDIKGCNYFPACADPRIIMVGSTRPSVSNYGRFVDLWENGQSQTAGGVTLTGTSQATAIATGKILDLALRKQASK